jgi:predicted permease
MGDFLTTFRQGIRRLARERLFTATAVITMALGIGANTALFSIVNAVLLRSLPVPNPHELRVVAWKGRNVRLSQYTGGGAFQSVPGYRVDGSFPYPAYCEFRDQGVGFADVFAFFPVRRLTGLMRGEASTVHGIMVSGNFFSGYGAGTLIGRPLTPEDDRLSAPPVAVITHSLWEQRFGLDPRVLGEALTLNRHSFSIVGVLPRDYVGPLSKYPAQVYVPLSAQPQLSPGTPLSSTQHWWVQVMARLAPDAAEQSAQASLDLLFRQALSASSAHADDAGIVLQDGRRGPLGLKVRLALPFLALMVVTSLVLLIACANLAGLLLARGAALEGDLAVRAAMGASRWKLVRDSLVESFLLALGGACGGLLLAAWGQNLLLAPVNALVDELRLDARIDLAVLGFALGLAVATTLLFGVLPAWRLSRVDPQVGLSQRSASGRQRLRLGKTLVAGQVGLAILLATVAGLLLRSFVNLTHVDPGFRTENVLLFKVNAGQSGYDGPARLGFYDRLRDEVAAIPGVRSVALSDVALGSGSLSANGITIPGRPTRAGEHLQANQLLVSDAFFATMGIPILLGRDLAPSDTDGRPRVAVVNELFVRQFLPGEQPLGRSFRAADKDYEIVGVCGNAKYQSLREDVAPTMYLSRRQSATGAMFYEVRAAVPPLSLVPGVRQRLAALDRNVPLENVGTQTGTLEGSLTLERLATSLSGLMALLAVLLSGIGLYGLMAFVVARRTREIGVRMALGAQPGDVSRAYLREALWLCGAGLAFGLPLSLAVGLLMRAVLFGVQPHDPVALLGAAGLLLGVGLLAAWLPARRAAKVDPMAALRCE